MALEISARPQFRTALAVVLIAVAVVLGITAWAQGLPPWRAPTNHPELLHLIRFYLPAAAALNLIIVAFLILGTKKERHRNSRQPDSAPPSEFEETTDPVERRVLTGVVVLSMALAAVLAVPRLNQSLWGDEHWTLRESIAGRFQRDLERGGANLEEAAAKLHWEGLGWEHALWRYWTTNHHFLYAVLGKGSHELWRVSSGADDWEFSEAALRFFPLAFGIAGIFLWARLLRPISPPAAALVAIALAAHPWYLRYITEARGYGLLFALLPALFLALRGAAGAGRTRDWVGVGVSQCLVLYAWPGTLPLVACLQASFLIAILWNQRRGREHPPLRRWWLTNLISAMVLLQLVAPCLPQVWEYLAEDVPSRPLGFRWLAVEFSWFTLGCEGFDNHDYAATNPLYVTMGGLLSEAPLRTGLYLALAALTAGIGAAVWVCRAPLGAVLLAGLVTATALSYAAAAVAGTALYSWYFVHLLPFCVALAALGTTWLLSALTRRVPPGAPRVLATSGASAALMLLYLLSVVPQLTALRTRSMDPRRESVAITRPAKEITDPAQLDIITAHANQASLSYDPHGWLLSKNEPDARQTRIHPKLAQLMRLADNTGAELWINVGSPDSLAKFYPGVAKMLAQENLFELAHRIHGLEPQYQRHLYRYLGGFFDPLKGLR